MSRSKMFFFSQYGWIALAVAVVAVILSYQGVITREVLYGALGSAVSLV